MVQSSRRPSLSSCSNTAVNMISPLSKPLRSVTRFINRPCASGLKTMAEIPGPRSFPVVGNFFSFTDHNGVFDPRELISIMQKQWDTYGDLVYFHMWEKRVLFVFNPNLAEQVYRASGTHPNRPGFDALRYVRNRDEITQQAKGLLTSSSNDWYQFRTKVQQPMVRPKSALRYTHDLEEIADEFIETKIVAGRNANNEVGEAFLEEMYKWGLESIACIALNARLGCLKPDLLPDSEQMIIVKAVSKLFFTSMHLDSGLQLWRYLPSPTLNQFKQCYTIFKDTCFKYIRKAIEEIRTKGPDQHGSDPTLLELLFERGSDEATAVVMALDMMFAGIDTSSHSVALTLFHLAKNPEKQQALFEEVLRELPTADSRLHQKSFDRMPYLRAVIKEMMRLSPAVVINGRVLDFPLELGGYLIDPGTIFTLCHYNMSISSKYVKEPTIYRPERWLRSHALAEKLHPFVYMPFGQGPRMCIGRRFAVQEISVLLAKIIRRFEVQWHHPDVVMKTEIITKPVSPLRFTFIDRST